MKDTKFGRIFFDSTRGRIVDLVRGGVSTVDELSRELGLTDNAVRAHLATLERDGLIEQRGIRQGSRKPHFSYSLTSEGEQLFPKAYHVLLNQLLIVLKRRIESQHLQSILQELADTLAAGLNDTQDEESLESRAQAAAAVLKQLGGAAKIEEENGKLLIRGKTVCPFALTVSQHPEIRQLAEILLSRIIGAKVTEHCQRGDAPQCSFEIGTSR